jgi:Stress responsive A/B Barrel Domain
MSALVPGRIRHTVSFLLVHSRGSAEEAAFLAAAARLADVVPGVEDFEVLREVSPKNPFVHGLSMEFADRTAYEAYNEHPEHVAFVRDRWLAEVSDFLEIDYEAR